MANTFGIRTNQPKRSVSISDLVSNHSYFVPVPGRPVIAVIERVERPIDEELFYIRFRGQKLFRRLTRTKGLITIVSRSSKIVLSKEEEPELEIEGRVAFLIEFPNGISDERLSILDRLCNLGSRE